LPALYLSAPILPVYLLAPLPVPSVPHEAIHKALAKNPRGIPDRKVQRITGIPLREVRRSLAALQDNGIAEKAMGRWRLKGFNAETNRPVAPGKLQAPPEGIDVIRRVAAFHADVVKEIATSKLEIQVDDERLSNEVTAPINWYELANGETSILRKDLRKTKLREGNRVVFCGPLHLVQRTKRGEDPELIWLPIFLLHTNTHRHQDRIGFELDGQVQVNLEWLDSQFASADEDLKNDLLIRLGLLEESRNGDVNHIQVQNFENCWQALQKHAPEISWCSSRSLRSPIQSEDLSCISKLGIYPRVLLFEEELGSYSKGLINDLRAISKASDDELASSALAALFPDHIPQGSTPTPSKPTALAQTTPLNPSQRIAVENGLNQSLSVVQGPPGTGKSAVVRATLLSAGVWGETAVFGSKNHRAVDAVVQPLNSKTEEYPLVADLRQGNNQRFWIEQLLANLGASNPGDEGVLEKLRNDLLGCKDKTNYQLDQLTAVCRQREILSEINYRILEHRSSDTAEWQIPAMGVALPSPPQQTIDLCKAQSLPWFHPRRFLTARARRRLLQDVRNQLPAFPSINNQDLIEIASWKELQNEERTAEKALCELPEINELGDSLFELVTKQLATTEDVMPTLPCAWAASIRSEGALLSQLRSEVRTRSRRASRHLEELGNEHLPTLLAGMPLWAITNLSVQRRIPAVAGAFDLAIIDEAGQCDPASVLPLFFRARRAMVVGDPQQLRPIGSLAHHKEDHLRQKHGLEGIEFSRFGYSGRSAYEMAHDALLLTEEVPGLLREHYRCHPEIAEFFNNEFYDGNLMLRTTARGKGRKHEGIRWTNVPGGSETYKGSRWHPPQVEAIVKELLDLAERKFDGTVGVVTPFREHAKRIRDATYQAIGPRQAEKWEFVSSTADGFQGGEKDLILFGLVGGGDCPIPTPPFYLRERNRFNVAVSRARHLLHVFGDLEWARHCEVSILNHLVEASEQSSQGITDDVRTELIGPVWEPKLAEEMRRAGIEFRQQYPACGMYLDFGLFADDGRKINIEVDGETYHRDRDGNLRAEDVQRDLTLRADGWTVQRFWVYQLREDMEKCIQKIKQILNN
jgi:very-short-patch-repair endonuclease